MLKTFISSKNEFGLTFDNFLGSGWTSGVEKIVKEKIFPEKFAKNNITLGWYYSEIEFQIEKEGIRFIIHFDDEGSIYMIMADAATSKNDNEKLKQWGNIIAQEIEKTR